MKKEFRCLLAVTVGLFWATLQLCFATEPKAAEPKSTVIAVPGLHCAGCAKKVTDQLKKLPDVDKAEADLKAKTVKVTPKKDTTLSPKALWEAVEKGEQVPTELKGPNGNFKEKPKS